MALERRHRHGRRRHRRWYSRSTWLYNFSTALLHEYFKSPSKLKTLIFSPRPKEANVIQMFCFKCNTIFQKTKMKWKGKEINCFGRSMALMKVVMTTPSIWGEGELRVCPEKNINRKKIQQKLSIIMEYNLNIYLKKKKKRNKVYDSILGYLYLNMEWNLREYIFFSLRRMNFFVLLKCYECRNNFGLMATQTVYLKCQTTTLKRLHTCCNLLGIF